MKRHMLLDTVIKKGGTTTITTEVDDTTELLVHSDSPKHDNSEDTEKVSCKRPITFPPAVPENSTIVMIYITHPAIKLENPDTTWKKML